MMKRMIFFPLALIILSGCTHGAPKYVAPPKNYSTVITYEANYEQVWEAALATLTEMGFTVTQQDKEEGQIETDWAETGVAPGRLCQYGAAKYWENPARRQTITVSLKAIMSQPAASQGWGQSGSGGAADPAGGWVAGAPAQKVEEPKADKIDKAKATEGAGEKEKSEGEEAEAVVKPLPPPPPPPPPPPVSTRTMVVVVSKGESVLNQPCGPEPAVVSLETDTTTEYRFLHLLGQKVGQTLEDPPPEVN